MGLSCGLVGLPLCGKTVIFNAVTAAGVSGSNGQEARRVVINVPDQRLQKLADLFHPRKVVPSTLEVADIPGIKPDKNGNGRDSRLLGNIKDAEALLHVVRCFDDSSIPFENPSIDPVRDIETVELELLAADSQTLQNKITRLEKKVRSGDKDAIRESTDSQKIFEGIQQGIPARRQGLSAREMASVKECNLVSLKTVLLLANIRSMEDANGPYMTKLKEFSQLQGAELMMVCGKDEADISQLKPEERPEFLRELGLAESCMERLIHAAYLSLGLITFFTCGEDEVRAWTCRAGDKAPVAAGKIHTDMEKGFIRMEVIHCDDMLSLGSEAACVKAGKQRIEGRDYEVKDGDTINVLFNSSGKK